jgi:hypothetical protein
VVLWSTNEEFLVGTTRTLSSLALVVWARSADEVREKTLNLRPDVVVIDVTAGGDTGTAESLITDGAPPQLLAIAPDASEVVARAPVDEVVRQSEVASRLTAALERLLRRAAVPGRILSASLADRRSKPNAS